jgi:hypothetical protein
MVSPFRLVRAAALVLTGPLVLAAPLAAQGAAFGGVKVSGFAEVSYTTSNHPAGDVVVGRLFDRFQDQFMLNALALALDKPYDPAKRSAGFHAELLFGQNAAVIKSGGFDLGTQGDIPHLYVTLNLPTKSGNGVQFKVGRIPTLMGLEVIETTVNPNSSEGNQFVYVENFTGLGLSVETKFSDRVDAQLRMINGWDLVREGNRAKSYMARIGLYPDANSSLAVLGFIGPEQAGNSAAQRSGVELLAWRKLGKAALWLQADVGSEEANAALPDPTQTANWWGVGAWLTYDLSSSVGLALRGDYISDQDGARTSGFLGFPTNTGHYLASATATLNIRSWPSALVRPELRYDHSSLPSFDGENTQITFALSVAYSF